jgi:hypothetical protein
VFILVSVLLLTGLATHAEGTIPTSEAAAARRCHPYRGPQMSGHIRIPNVREISGAVASRRFKQTLWVQQDSGPADGTRRTEVQVYWFREPRLRQRHVRAKKLTLAYPGRDPHNAEAMFVTGGHLFIVTKVRGDSAQVFRTDVKPLRGGAHRHLSLVGRLHIGGVTAADVGRRGILIKNHTRANFYRWAGGHRVTATLRRRPCVRPTGAGEAVALATWSNAFYSIPEGASPPIWLSRPR